MLAHKRIIGIPKEVKTHEYRVAVTPAQVHKLVSQGNKVIVGKNAGVGSGYSDGEYMRAGARICDNTNVFAESDVIVKVKEPQPTEYELIKPNQVLFTYFHFASSKTLTDAMRRSGAICIAYESVAKVDGRLPLLAPMSEIAGLLSVQQGMKYLEKTYEGKGVLLSGSSLASPGNVLVIGGGTAGTAAATLAASMGANVYILDNSVHKIDVLQQHFETFPNVHLVYAPHSEDISDYLQIADLVIGAVLVPGCAAPKLITKEMIQKMPAGSVFVDIAIDQGGMTEVSYPTTHDRPIYKYKDVTMYCVANMPAAVSRTSTQAISTVVYPYLEQIAGVGWRVAAQRCPELFAGLSMMSGHVTKQEIADQFGYEFTDPYDLLRVKTA